MTNDFPASTADEDLARMCDLSARSEGSLVIPFLSRENLGDCRA